MRVDTVRKLSRGSRRTSDHQGEPDGGRDHRDAKERLNLRNHCNFVILFRAAFPAVSFSGTATLWLDAFETLPNLAGLARAP